MQKVRPECVTRYKGISGKPSRALHILYKIDVGGSIGNISRIVICYAWGAYADCWSNQQITPNLNRERQPTGRSYYPVFTG